MGNVLDLGEGECTHGASGVRWSLDISKAPPHHDAYQLFEAS